MTDPIGDLITRIKNASAVKKESVSVPFSKMKLSIAEILSSKGYVGAVSQKSKGGAKHLSVELIYDEEGKPKVNDVQRISKPSRRLYESAKNIRKFRKGYGMSVFSTPKGILADMDAKKENVGGEILFNIW